MGDGDSAGPGVCPWTGVAPLASVNSPTDNDWEPFVRTATLGDGQLFLIGSQRIWGVLTQDIYTATRACP